MTDRQTTASAIISFSEALEDEAANFYQRLSKAFPQHEAMFSEFVDQSHKNKVLLIRTYRETVSDALETGFAFEGLNLGNYAVDTSLDDGAGLGTALAASLAMEDKAVAFYLQVAEQSRSLLATIPRAFRRVARSRDDRRQMLRKLYGGQ